MSVDTTMSTPELYAPDDIAENTLHTNGQPNTEADDLLGELERSAFAQDYHTFLDHVVGVEWSARPPEHILKAIDMALLVGASRLAMCLSQESVRLFPDDPRCQWSARVIAPAHVVGTRPATARSKGLNASMDWVAAHAKTYRGQWVAVSHGKLVASASSLEELDEMIEDEEDPGSILVTKVF